MEIGKRMTGVESLETLTPKGTNIMDLITGKILKLNNWPDGKIIGLAKDAGNKMLETGMERDAALSKLEAVRSNPGSVLADPLLANLARECIRISQSDEPSVDELRDSP